MKILSFCGMGTKSRPVMLWFDHSLGGGTETYSKNQFRILQHQYSIFRVQYFSSGCVYVITNVSSGHKRHIHSLAELYAICIELGAQKIVVNNLVGYPSTMEMLDLISCLCAKCIYRPHVSFRGHDFQCICPSYNLINCDGVYCACDYPNGCSVCWRSKRLSPNIATHHILKSGATDIKQWRSVWYEFLCNTVNEIIVFSNSTKHILSYVYPDTTNKIIVIPHSVKKYRAVYIRPHRDINIVVLGNISYAKGAAVICEMAKYLHLYPGVKISVLGKFTDAPDNIYVYGRYSVCRLPRMIRRTNADLVFIPSVWPETFSYTTSEAMSMGLPVACYDMGAPSERVSRYAHGLVLQDISPHDNLIQIIEFINRIKDN